MLNFVSIKGKAKPVNFEDALLNGFAEDGGMYVPERIPHISMDNLASWQSFTFQELAYEILSLYIDEKIIPAEDLKNLIQQSTNTFSHSDIVPVQGCLSNPQHYLLELFHGPTLSFKDVAMGFLVNCMNYFLERKQSKATLLIATTGDTGPAAAYASIGKPSIDCWVLYPRGFISEEQERQITTLRANNVHAVAVEHCSNGGDDLDDVIAELFADREFVAKTNLSSVNSINWCRVMFQSIHYIYSYLQVVDNVGDPIVFSVPTGAFGNLFAGYLAREMGLPVQWFICANNQNAAIHRLHETGIFNRSTLVQTPSNAIDIALPYNYWRFLYFASGQNSQKVTEWMDSYWNDGGAKFNKEMLKEIKRGFKTDVISNEETLNTIKNYYYSNDYLLDPHGAVAVAAAQKYLQQENTIKVISLLTAHPAKFPEVIKNALKTERELPDHAKHSSIEKAQFHFQYIKLIDQPKLKRALMEDLI